MNNPMEYFRKGAELRKKKIRSKAMFQKKGELPVGYDANTDAVYTINENNDLYNTEVSTLPSVSMIDADLNYYQRKAANQILQANRNKLVKENNAKSKITYKQQVKDGDIITPFQGTVNQMSYNLSDWAGDTKKNIKKAFIPKPNDSSCTVSKGTISPDCVRNGKGGRKRN